MEKKVSPKVHVLYSSHHWHISWNLFVPGYRHYAVNFRRYTSIGVEYHFGIDFGKGSFGIMFFFPKKPQKSKDACN